MSLRDLIAERIRDAGPLTFAEYMELALYREYRDVVGLFSHVVETERRFYLANEVLLVPTFGLPEDARAAAILREVIPGRTLVPVPARDLVQGLGAIHCLTQQEPRLAAE